MNIIGYSDRFSVQPGQTIRFMVSSGEPSYRTEIVRLRHIDENPKGPGFNSQSVETDVSGRYQGRPQTIHTGSYVNVPHDPLLNCTDGFTLQAWIFPTTPQKGLQGLLTKWSDHAQTGSGLIIDEDGSLGLMIGNGNGQVEQVRTNVAMKARHWYFVAATYDAPTGRVCLYQEPLAKWPLESPTAAAEETIQPHAVGVNSEAFLMAAYWQTNQSGEVVTTAHFNGKIDSPRLYNLALEREQIEQLKEGGLSGPDDTLIGSWDFSLDISSEHVADTSPHGHHGHTVNIPMRAVTGHNWSGDEVDFRANPSEYGAIYFHDDDLEVAGWEIDFEWTVPDQFPSGVYAARLSTDDAEDYIPFVVRPVRGEARARIAFLAPSVTYLAYANQQFNDSMRVESLGREDSVHVTPHDQYMRDHKLLSLYDMHSDGTGVCYSSRLRPILNMKPKYRMPALSLAATSPHGLNADLHLLDWMDTKLFEYDVITDDDLHQEGADLLGPYQVVVTGTHPEYWTTQMLDGLESYLANGGRVMYLGGNGFYWVTSFDPKRPHIIEIRRWGGTRSWEARPGEYHHSTTGEIGGLWRFRNREPQKMLGVGFTSMGSGRNRPYQRQPDSFDPRAAFIFKGIDEEELIGDFPSLVYEHGAAGFEIDRMDHALGTPDHALLLASSSGHSDKYQLAIEDQLASGPSSGGSQNSLVRADMVYFEGPNSGAVFSVGSISWCGCLSYNDYDNNISRITENVLRRFAADG